MMSKANFKLLLSFGYIREISLEINKKIPIEIYEICYNYFSICLRGYDILQVVNRRGYTLE